MFNCWCRRVLFPAPCGTGRLAQRTQRHTPKIITMSMNAIRIAVAGLLSIQPQAKSSISLTTDHRGFAEGYFIFQWRLECGLLAIVLVYLNARTRGCTRSVRYKRAAGRIQAPHRASLRQIHKRHKLSSEVSRPQALSHNRQHVARDQNPDPPNNH